MNSTHASSLGLHPVVYFYSQDGRHKIASFYATLAFVKELDEKKRLNDFTKVRESFEKVLLQSENLVQQINRKYRSAIVSYSYIKEFYFEIINELLKNTSKNDVLKEIMKNEKFNYLTSNIENNNEILTNKFSTERKSAVYIKEALLNTPKCKICGGFIHRNSITIDHIDRKQDGGLGTIDNGQITHPYCNTTYKN